MERSELLAFAEELETFGDTLLREFDADQPRDADGKFAGGGSSSKPANRHGTFWKNQIDEHNAKAHAASLSANAADAAGNASRADQYRAKALAHNKAAEKALQRGVASDMAKYARYAKAGLTKRDASGAILSAPHPEGYFVAHTARYGFAHSSGSGAVYGSNGVRSGNASELK